MSTKTSITEQMQKDFALMGQLTDRERSALRGYFLEPSPENKLIAYLAALDKASEENNKVKNQANSGAWFRKESCQAYLRVLQNRFIVTNSNDTSIEDIEVTDETFNRANQIKRYKSVADTTNDLRVKLSALEKIDKLTGILKETPTEGEKVVFYLPLTCHYCKYYQEKQEQRRNEQAKTLKKK